MAAPTPSDLTPFLTERTWERISKRLIVRSGCWGFKSKPGTGDYHAYTIWVNGRSVSTKLHRIVYGFLIGPIAEGLQLDHLCRERSCLNPWHCEPVPQKENILRGLSPAAKHAEKKTCSRGHEFTAGVGARSGARECRVCKRALYVALPEETKARYREAQRLKLLLNPRPKKPPKPRRDTCRRGHNLSPSPWPSRKGRICLVCFGETYARAKAGHKARLAAKRAATG